MIGSTISVCVVRRATKLSSFVVLGGHVLTDVLPCLDDRPVILVDLSLSSFSRLSKVAK